MRLNVKRTPQRVANWPKTHEGGPAYPEVSTEQQLLRSVLACLLWENQFYESGVSIADRISALADKAAKGFVGDLAVRARNDYKLRHAPLLLLNSLVKTGRGSRVVGDAIRDTISRPDELAELMAIYWKDGRKPLSNQLKRGLRMAFGKFDAYQLAKYNRAGLVSLRDVMFLVHPRPEDEKAAGLYKQLADRDLKNTETWEAKLSAGGDKRETWAELLQKGKLGYMALLRNLRNMEKAGVDRDLINAAIRARKGAHKVLPFRFVAAARHGPAFIDALDEAFRANVADIEADSDRTVVLVDLSYSMQDKLSGKSDMLRWDAAAALAVMIPGNVRTFVFSNDFAEVKHEGGLRGIEAIINSIPHGGTQLGAAVDEINRNVEYDRLIVITDEQAHDYVEGPKGRGYMINVASYQNGVGYGRWVHIDGFSEQVLRFIAAYESETV